MGNTTLFFISHQQGWMKIRRKLGGKEMMKVKCGPKGGALIRKAGALRKRRRKQISLSQPGNDTARRQVSE